MLDTWPALSVDWVAVVGTFACWLPLHHYHGHYEEKGLQSAQEIKWNITAVMLAGILSNIIQVT